MELNSQLQLPIASSIKWGSLEEARRTLQANLISGTICPCCGQFAKIYKRKLNSGMAVHLIALFKLDAKAPKQYFHLSEVVAFAHRHHAKPVMAVGYDWPTARFWGLLEEKPNDKDHKKTSGFWRITDLGKSFVLGHVALPKYHFLFNGSSLGTEGPEITVWTSLGSYFNYNELMEE